MRVARKTIAAAGWLMAAWLGLGPGGPAPAVAEAPQVHALTGVRIVVAPGEVIERGTVVIRDGVIEAVGAEVEIPADARVWDQGKKEDADQDGAAEATDAAEEDSGEASADTDSEATDSEDGESGVGAEREDGEEIEVEKEAPRPVTVYAGLIDLYTELDWPLEPSGGPSGPAGRGGGGGGSGGPGGGPPAPQDVHENTLVRPEREMSRFAANSGHAKKLRAAGITTAVVAPEPGLLRGVSALVNLGDGDLGHSLLRSRVAQNVTFDSRSFREGYPTSLMGSIALLRQTMSDARWYGRAHDAYRARPGQTRPPYNRSLEALEAAAAGIEPVVFEAENLDNLFRAGRLVEELGLDAWYVATGHEYRHLDAVTALGRPLVVPLDFPDTPEVGDEDDLTVSLEDLRHWDRAPSNPGALIGAGMTVALTSHGLDDVKKVHPHVAKALERGLSADDALAAWTTVPAELLGISDVAGTVEAGKMANLVLVEGDLFADKPEIREVWVDGRRFELKEVKPPEVDPVGTWELEVQTGAGPLQTVLTVTGEVGSLSGFFNAMGQRIELTEVSVSGKTLNLGWDGASMGMPGAFTMSLRIQGDTANGGGSGPPGSFSVKGKRTSGGGPGEVAR